jgi:hypothetical protein
VLPLTLCSERTPQRVTRACRICANSNRDQPTRRDAPDAAAPYACGNSTENVAPPDASDDTSIFPAIRSTNSREM